ncbi:hypothetical protein FWC31_03550 [Candidatus Saccharibacteria bacterium]|nr:hypothetical protein [Candidatus Saccharibacteria bacterium]
MKKFSLLAAVSILLINSLTFLMGVSTVSAAEASRIQIDVSPVEISLLLVPGKTYDGEFNITNRSTDTFDFQVAANSFFVKNLTYETTFDEEITFSQIVRWITFDEENFYNIKPDEKQTITYHIKVPEDAPGGGQYAVLFAIVSSETINESVNIKTNSRVGMKMYVKVAGETRNNGQIKSMIQDGFYSKAPINSVAQIENTGNIDFNSNHEYVVKSLFGRELFRDSTIYRIMPDTTREINMIWEGTPYFGIFRVRNRITFLGETKYDQEKIVIIAPIWLIIVAVIVLLLLIGLMCFLVLLIIKKIRHRKTYKKQKNNLHI